MDRTEEAVRETLAGVDAPSYDLGILSERGMFPKMDAIDAAQVISRLRYLKYRNARGAHIYFRPSGERRYTVVDDLDGATLARMTEHGFEPCTVIETSPGNYQAWLKHSRLLSKALGTFAAQTLARRFAADPSAADWRRFGRLAGFTNRKPQHRTATGLFPYVSLHSYAGQQFTSAESFDSELVRLQRSRELEQDAQRQRSQSRISRSSGLQLGLFRALPKYRGRPAAADMAFAIAAFAGGWSESEIADALASEYLSRNTSTSRRAAYVNRTTQKAMLWTRNPSC